MYPTIAVATWFLGSSAFAAEAPTPTQLCRRALSGDERLARLSARSAEDPAVLGARARLINEAWWPAMRVLRDLVVTTPDQRIRTLGRHWASRLDFTVHRSVIRPKTKLALGDRFPYDRAHDEHFRLGVTRPEEYPLDLPRVHPAFAFDFQYPFQSHNRDFMRKIYVASFVFMLLIRDHEREIANGFPADNTDVLKAHSFTGVAAGKTLYLAVKTFVQALALVTAMPIEGYDAEEVGRRASAPHRAVSTIERLALAFPPTIFGRYGDDLYVSGAIAIDESGRPRLTPKMNRFLRRAHDAWSRERINRDYEFGFGCPVAYASLERGCRTGVGLMIESFWSIYDRL